MAFGQSPKVLEIKLIYSTFMIETLQSLGRLNNSIFQFRTIWLFANVI